MNVPSCELRKFFRYDGTNVRFMLTTDPFFGDRPIGNHPPGVGRHPPGIGRHGPAWSKWRAYIALKAWKKAITDDPKGILKTWVGKDVCKYEGVFCSPPEDPDLQYLEVVAGIDLNDADLKGTLVPELGLLREIGIFHLNSNRFSGEVPDSFRYMKTLFELDLSNNQLSGSFPLVVLDIPNLVYLDIRFNEFFGKLPRELFSKPTLDAIFVNNCNFEGDIPDNFGESPVSAVVLANNRFDGSIPSSIRNMSNTLNEIVALGNNFHGTLPSEIGSLKNVNLFDYSANYISGGLPTSIKNMRDLEVFDMSRNYLAGTVTAELCGLNNLTAVALDYNYFKGVDPTCARLGDILSLVGNCVPGAPGQKDEATCAQFYGLTPPRTPSNPTPSNPPRSSSPPPPTPSNPPRSPSPPPPSPSSPPPSPSQPPPSPPPPSPSPPPPSPSPPPPSPSPPPPPVVSPPPPPVISPPPPPPYISPAPQPDTECPEGYEPGKKSGTCFMLVKEPQTWAEAEYYCRQHSDGHLAAPADWDELRDLGKLCYKSNRTVFRDENNPWGLGCYLGGRRPYTLEPETNGWNYPGYPCIEFNQSFWNHGEPNNLGGQEGCLTIKFESKEQARDKSKLPYMLNDLRCDVQLPFICSLTRCEDGCDNSNTCKTLGDDGAECHSDASAAVGYSCDCSNGYSWDESGTCVPE